MSNYNIPSELSNWADEIGCAVTICDKDANILYMNDRSRATFSPDKDIIGHNLKQYHPSHAIKKIEEMLQNDTINAYTINKKGVKKLIYQTPWHKDGEVAGLVELSIPLPADMPHYER